MSGSTSTRGCLRRREASPVAAIGPPHTGTERRLLASGELVVLVLLFVAYTAIRARAGGDTAAAVHHARLVAHLEWPVFTLVERPLNHALVAVPVLAVAACYYYAALHYLVTPAVLLFSRARGGWQYARGYLALVIGSGIGLLGYAFFPSAPPRLVPGLHVIDVLARFGQYGWWGDAASAPRGIGDATNQYAAMPSLHFGWSLWCGIQLWGLGGRGGRSGRIWRVVGVAYPALQMVVVVATGNHFLLDVLAGGLCIVAGYAVATLVLRWWDAVVVR